MTEPLRTKIAEFVDNVLNHEAWASTGNEAADHILQLIAEHQPQRRVFFLGDTVPAGVAVQAEEGDVVRYAVGVQLDEENGWDGPAVEVQSLTLKEWQAAVARARAEREDKQ